MRRRPTFALALRATTLLCVTTLPCAGQTAAPPLTPKLVFVPGLYETESRNSAFQDQGAAAAAKSKTCIASADFDAFERETIAQYRASPAFMKACKLSDNKQLPDGFAFAMDCKDDKIILAFHFSRNMVSSTTQTLIVDRPEYSSTILTLSRRIGDCPGQTPGKAL